MHATLVTIWNLCIEFDCIHSAFTTVRHKSSSSASASASTAASNDAPSSVLDPDIVTKLKVFKHKWSIMEGCCPICGDHGGDQCPGLFCAVETCVPSMMRRSPSVFPFSSILDGKVTHVVILSKSTPPYYVSVGVSSVPGAARSVFPRRSIDHYFSSPPHQKPPKSRAE